MYWTAALIRLQRVFNAEIASVRDAARGNTMAGRLRMAFWKDFVEA